MLLNNSSCEYFASGSSDYDVYIWEKEEGTGHVGLISGNANENNNENGNNNNNINDATNNNSNRNDGKDEFNDNNSVTSSIDSEEDERMNIENWRPRQSLGHPLDVQDVAWSPNDHYIATACADHVVRIFKCIRSNNTNNHYFKVIQELKCHTGWVNGISWDPLGQYICSQV